MSQTLVPSVLSFGSHRRPVLSSHSSMVAGIRAVQPKPDQQRHTRLQATSAHSGTQEDDETQRINKNWQQSAFPTYLQNGTDDFCQAWEEALQAEERRQSQQAHHGVGKKTSAVTRENPVWRAMRSETRKEAAKEPLLSSFLYASILSHDTFARSLAFVLANRLSDATMLATELFELFHTLLRDNEEVEQAALADVIAVRERDPACCMYSSALLFYKGYHALQTHRIAHTLWHRNQRVMARTLQSRVSEVCAIDIHPAARIGKGILLDHGTGVVIGETAVIGENVSIMQNVTLGGTGKAGGDRHPKIHNNVLIGASATVLGNIIVGKGAQVAAGSMVLKDVPPRTMVAGSPAKVVGCVQGNAAEQMQHCPSMASLDNPQGHDGLFCENWDSALQSQPTQSAADTTSSPPTAQATRPTPSPPIPVQPDPEPTHSRPVAAASIHQSEPAVATTQNESGTAAVSPQPSPAPLSSAVHQASAELGTILFTEEMLRDGPLSGRSDPDAAAAEPDPQSPPHQEEMVRDGLSSGSDPDAAAAEPDRQSPANQDLIVDIGPQSHIASSSGGLDVSEQNPPEMTPSPPDTSTSTSQQEPSSASFQHKDHRLQKQEGPKASGPSQQSPPSSKPSRPYKHDPPGHTPSDNLKPDPERRTRPALVPPGSQSRELNGVPVNGVPVNGTDSGGMRPLTRVGLAASASETARKLAPKQSQQADEGRAHQQQQKLSDDARGRLARMSSIASSAQEGTWVDASSSSSPSSPSSPATAQGAAAPTGQSAAAQEAAAPTGRPDSAHATSRSESQAPDGSAAASENAPTQGGSVSSSSSSRKPISKGKDPNQLLDYFI